MQNEVMVAPMMGPGEAAFGGSLKAGFVLVRLASVAVTYLHI
jgi:hypothetical protein